MTEQPPSAEAQALAERIHTWQGYAFIDGRVAQAIDILIEERVAAETERWQNRDRQRLDQIDRLQETVQSFQSARDEREAAAIRAFGSRVWSDTEEVAYQAGVRDTRARLQEPNVRSALSPYLLSNDEAAADAALTKIAEMLK